MRSKILLIQIMLAVIWSILLFDILAGITFAELNKNRRQIMKKLIKKFSRSTIQKRLYSRKPCIAMLITTILPIVLIGIVTQATPMLADADLGTWRQVAPMPTARYCLAAAEVNGKLYAIGGIGGLGNTVEEYNPATNTWHQVAPMLTARWPLAAAEVNGKLYAVESVSAS